MIVGLHIETVLASLMCAFQMACMVKPRLSVIYENILAVTSCTHLTISVMWEVLLSMCCYNGLMNKETVLAC